MTVTTRGESPTGGRAGNRLAISPVVRHTVSEEIRTDLAGRIRAGELRPGDRLPSERTLCEQYRVARTSVREAIQGLVSLGLVARRANRTYVAEQLVVDLAAPKLVIAELFETRLLFEAPLARLAAERAGARQRAGLVSLAASFRPSMPWRRFHPANEEFHWAIATAVGNTLLSELYGKILDAFLCSEEYASLTEAPLSAEDRRQVVVSSGEDHRAIAAAIAAGEPPRAEASAGHHLANVMDRLLPLLP